MSRELADLALDAAKSKGASYTDVRIQRTRQEALFSREDKLQNTTSTDNNGIGIRVLVDGTWGFAATCRMDKDSVARAAAEAVAIARANRPSQAQPVELVVGPEDSRHLADAHPEGPLPRPDLGEGRPAPLDERRGDEGRGRLHQLLRLLRAGGQDLRLQRGELHHPAPHPGVADVLRHRGRQVERPLPEPRRARHPGRRRLGVRREPTPSSRRPSSPPNRPGRS